jgi:hypothetical protein
MQRSTLGRIVQFITQVQAWDCFVAGVEGGLIMSDKYGVIWRWVLRQQSPQSGSYPYIKHFLLIDKDTALIGGFDKAKDGRPFLHLTQDRGATWIDISGSLWPLGTDVRQLPLLARHPDGRIIAATQDASTNEMVLAELVHL